MLLETRIDWSVKFLSMYFSADGMLLKLLNKDHRSLQFHKGGSNHTGLLSECDSKSSSASQWRCCGNVYASESGVQAHRCEVIDLLEERMVRSSM